MKVFLGRIQMAVVIAVAVSIGSPSIAAAKPNRKARKAATSKKQRRKARGRSKSKSPKTQHFDFSGIQLSGFERKPQLLYFLERANQELERASLRRRSFIPEMVRSVEEGQF